MAPATIHEISGAADASTGRPDRLLKTLSDFLTDLNVPGPLGVAVSGGSDSTGLLMALNEANSRLDAPRTLVALTVDHGLRQASAAEANAVKALCRRLGLAHETLRWAGPKPGSGIQAAARAARYALMSEAASRLKLIGLVTGHSRDDQRETIAMRRQRSADCDAPGLAGIPPATLYDGRLWVMRPLLDTGRSEIRDWLAGQGQDWIDDPSNIDSRFERVRMRAMLAQRQPDALTAAADVRTERAGEVAALIRNCGVRRADGRFELAGPGSSRDMIAAALEAMIGVAGGRERAMDRGGRALLADFVAGMAGSRCTLGRVVLKRERDGFVMWRERRDLPRLDLAPGEAGPWDGRFRIRNLDGERTLAVRAGAGAGALPEMLRQNAEISEVFEISEGARGGFAVSPVCGRASRLLPVFELELAQALANMAGAEPFMACPWQASLNK